MFRRCLDRDTRNLMRRDQCLILRRAPRNDHTAAAGGWEKNTNAIATVTANAIVNANESTTAIARRALGHAATDARTIDRFVDRTGDTES